MSNVGVDSDEIAAADTAPHPATGSMGTIVLL